MPSVPLDISSRRRRRCNGDSVTVSRSQDGTTCIAGARDRTLVYWKLPSREKLPSHEIGNSVCIDSAHNGWIWDLTAIDNTIYSCSWDQSVKSWMLINTGLVQQRTYEMYAIAKRLLPAASR